MLENSFSNSVNSLVTYTVRNHTYLLPPTYINMGYIGEGSYGVVASAYDTVHQQAVAIKKMSPFEHYVCSMRALREIKFVCTFSHDNIISVLDIVASCAPGQRHSDIYLIFEKMDADLAYVLRDQQLKPDYICYFTYQILRGLKYLHSANIVHRDLKPSNLLVNANCDLKICDFGLSRVSLPDNIYSAIMTEYVATRWYRAPEIMLNSRCYGLAIDIWSVGCILGEMLLQRPLFQGQHYMHQIELILKFLGSPSPDDMKYIHNEKARMFLRKQPKQRKVNYKFIFPNAGPNELDLMDRCLTFNPVRRYTVYQSISHPYLAEYHDDDDEPVYYKQFQIDEDVGEDIRREDLMTLIVEEIGRFEQRASG